MHRLFHTLVVCGAGLTLVQCGGKSNTGEERSGASCQTYRALEL
jgi:hypothetical protein